MVSMREKTLMPGTTNIGFFPFQFPTLLSLIYYLLWLGTLIVLHTLFALLLGRIIALLKK
jgi:hypothetical protein